MVTIEEALRLIHTRVTPVATEIVPIEEADGRVAAEAITARYDLPRFDNSAMDGFAVTLSDAGSTLRCRATILAGDTPEGIRVEKGSAVKIMTGAMIPAGTDAVIPKESVQIDGDTITLPDAVRKGANIRKRGEDVSAGSRIFERGETITAYGISLLASQGITHVRVYRRPLVTVFATGHELKMHYEKVESYQIYNSNAPMFVTRAKELGCEARFTGATADTLASIEAHIQSALDADLIITSGGVSVGEADFTLQAFENLGMERLFHKIDIKPGKPTTLGRIGKTWVLNLPGNPAAAAANFEIFGHSLIRRLRGVNTPYLAPIIAFNAEDYTLKPGKRTVLLGRYDGEKFHILSRQGPGMVRPFKEADGFIVTDGKIEKLETGQSVQMIPLQWIRGAEEERNIFTSA